MKNNYIKEELIMTIKNEELNDEIEERADELQMKFKNIRTGEIVSVTFGDHEKFDEIMSSREYRLIFC